MQKKPLTLSQVRYNQIKSDLKFWSPVERNGWYIKFSFLKDEQVLLIFVSAYTCQTIIRYFDNENCESNARIEQWMSINEPHDLECPFCHSSMHKVYSSVSPFIQLISPLFLFR